MGCRLSRFVASLVLVMGLPTAAAAVRITADLRVIDVAADVAGVVSVGDTGSGVWEIDGTGFALCTTGNCLLNPPGITTYLTTNPTPLSMNASVGPWTFSETALVNPQIDVWNDFSVVSPTLTGTFDAWSVIQAVYSGGYFPGSSGPALPLAPGNAAVVQLFLGDSTATRSSDGSFYLPVSATAFDTVTFVLSEIDANGFVRTLFISEATSFTIPEPGVAFLVLGGLGLASAHRGRGRGRPKPTE